MDTWAIDRVLRKKKKEKNVGRFPNVFSLLKIVNDARLHTKQRQVLFPKPSLSAHYLRDGVDPLSWSCYGDQNRIHNQNIRARISLLFSSSSSSQKVFYFVK